MKQKYAVVMLFALIIASSMVSLTSYKTTEKLVTEDVNQALAKALDEQQSDVISADTIQVFNSHLQIEGLRGNAVLAVDTKKGFRPRPQVSTATILSLSDQRPSMILWSMVLLWSMFCLYQHRLWRLGAARWAVRQCQRLRSKTNPDATATDGDTVAVALASAVESRDLRCPLA